MKKVLKVLDLESIPCPLNVVKCKLALEKLSLNESLLVYINKGEPEEMVKKALIAMRYSFKIVEEDHRIIKLQISHGNW